MRPDSTADKSITDDASTGVFDALLVIGHGTRDPAGLAEFRSFVDQLAREKTDWHVADCFLELAEPSIAMAVDHLAAHGLSRIRAMPLMLFSAGHAKRDIPNALAQARAKNPGVEIEVCPPLGCHQAIVDLSVERCRQAIAGRAAVAPDETLLILVGRGSSDVEATAHMRRLADLRRAKAASGGSARHSSLAAERHDLPGETGGFHVEREDARLRLAHIEVGFVAVAAPSLGTVLEQAAQTDFRRVIVQPHLLFAGNVLAEIHRLVEQQRLAEPARDGFERQWIVTDALGPDPRLVTAVVDIASGVTPRTHGL